MSAGEVLVRHSKTNILGICSAGGDPFLTGEVAFEMIEGIQSQGVQACAKHLINKFELFPPLTGSGADALVLSARATGAHSLTLV